MEHLYQDTVYDPYEWLQNPQNCEIQSRHPIEKPVPGFSIGKKIGKKTRDLDEL